MLIQSMAVSPLMPGRRRISAIIGGESLWFETPDETEFLDSSIESFLIMGLASSMLNNERLVVDPEYAVSQTLLRNLDVVQHILHCWNPRFRVIPIEARTRDAVKIPNKVASTFSGGVDSICAALRHRNRLTSLIYIGGFDFEVEDQALASAFERNRQIAEILELPLVVIRTNQKAWGLKTGVARNFWHSSYLAAASLLTGASEVLIPSTHSYARLNPIGSHPVLDHLWSNGATQFVHADADLRRSDKLALIAKEQRLVDKLHVCWRDPVNNCGACDKCLRTMITLDVLGVEGPFPRKLALSDIARMSIANWERLDYAVDNLLLADEHGRPDIVVALKRAIRRYDRTKALEYLDRGLFGTFFRRLRIRFRPYTGNVGFTNGRPDLDC